MFPATVNAQAQPASGTAQRLRRGAGCVGCLTVVVLLLFVVGAGLEFQLATPIVTMSNAITGVPKVVNGKLQMSNVTVEGPVGLVMSPDDITALLNKHFADAQTHLQRPISSVQLKDHEMDLILG